MLPRIHSLSCLKPLLKPLVLHGLLCVNRALLPTGSEEKGVLGVESIPVAILTSCQDVEIIAL